MDNYKKLEAEVFFRNNSSVERFEGLTPVNFHHILYDTYSENSPVHLQKHISSETLDKIPLFRIAEDLIRIIEREKFIKLTPLGALPRKVVIELYEKKHICEDIIEIGISKIWNEQDSQAISSTKVVLNIAGITKKTNGKLTLTKKGTNFLKLENRQIFFELFIMIFADKFNWGYNDRYPDEPIGQRAWTFSIYLLHKFGKDFQKASFYAEKYSKAIPDYIKEFEENQLKTQIKNFSLCYGVRTFYRFLDWFGIIENETKSKSILCFDKFIKPTEVLDEIFVIEKNGIMFEPKL